jgi:RNA polymerase subunit RPABC4/transcription elongation factor Spt4
MPFCSSCGQETDGNAAFCPSCGNQLQPRKQSRLNQNQNMNTNMNTNNNVCPKCHGTGIAPTYFLNPLTGQEVTKMLQCRTCHGTGPV